MEGLGLHHQEVDQLLAGVNDHGASQADQGVDRKEEPLLLVRLGPEHQEPKIERGLGKSLRQVMS